MDKSCKTCNEGKNCWAHDTEITDKMGTLCKAWQPKEPKILCNCGRRELKRCLNCLKYKEAKMKTKLPQMTEEQAIVLLKIVFETNNSDFPYAINALKQAGYIINNLVEEAEEMFSKWNSQQKIND